MSNVRLVCYPDRDGLFTAQVSLSMRVELPNGQTPEAMMPAVLDELRSRYPEVAIKVEPPIDGGPQTWHVYRDGAPIS